MGAAPGRSDESHQDPDGDGRPPEAARLRDKVQADPAKDKHEQERIVGSVARGPQSRKGPGSSPSEGEALGVGRRGRGSRRGQWSWAERVHASQWGQPGGRTVGRHCSWVPSSGRSLPWQGNVPTGCTGDRLHSPCTKPFHRHTPFMAPLSQPTLTAAGPASPRPCWTRSGRGKAYSERSVLSCPRAQPSSTH